MKDSSNQHNNNVIIVLLVAMLPIFYFSCSSDQSGQDNSVNKQQGLDTLDMLNTRIEEQPDVAENYYLRGRYYYEHAVYSESIRDLIKCVEVDSSNEACWFLLADAYMEDHRSRPAIETLEDYLEVEPNRISTLLKLSKFQIIIKRYQAAHFNLNAVLKQQPRHDEALFLKGVIYRYEDQPIQAVEYLQQAIQSNPDLVEGHLMLGQLFEEAGNPMAEKYYENALRVNPGNPEVKLALANYYWLSDRIDLATVLFQELLDEHPGFARGHYNTGLLYLELDSLAAAESYFESAILYEPEFILAHYYLGETYLLKGDPGGAIPHLEEAMRLSPSDERIGERLQEARDLLTTGREDQ